MSVGISISSGVDLAANSWELPKSPNRAVIPDNESFHQALQSASENASNSASNKKDSPEKISGVAKQFEALLVGQILKSAREASGGGWMGNEDDQDDQTGSLVMEMAEQGLSQAIAAHGGLGIAKMVTANLERGSLPTSAKTPNSDSEGPPRLSLKSKETKSNETKHAVTGDPKR
jgi:flagellar protein FlgJ